MMPLMFGFFSLVFPSGLTVYIFTNTILSMFHQLYMNRTDPQVAAARTGAGTSARPAAEASKPAGPRTSGRKKK